MSHIVVIGAGQAGASLVARLRQDGFAGDVTLIGAEPVPPYQRPPLSKAYLLGEMARDRLFLRPESFYAEQDIALRLGRPVTGIDRTARTVSVGAEVIAYDLLALTTGSEPRRLPAAIGGDLDGVFVVRTLADIDAMAPRVVEGARALIVGGGYIGLEAAAVCAGRGVRVTVVEMAGRILQRVAAAETSAYFRALHSDHGVVLREGVGLERLTGEAGRVTGARLADGTELAVDFAVVGVGVVPATGLAEAAGLEIDNGIAVDAQGRTSDPAIWAAGDCASFPCRGGRLRLESVPNAIDMAECVAGNMLGAGVDYVPKPWFWSDQYDVKLQIAGLGTGHDRVVTRPGEGRTASMWYYAGDRLLAVDAMNDPRAYMIGKRLIEAGRTADPALVADPGADLQGVVAAVRIIAGRFRGRALAAVGKGDAGAHLRPTADRVRESLFNVLAGRGVLEGARVLDLFAGTGALGLEALSRGAAHVAFVDDGRVAQGLIRRNVALTGSAGEATLIGRDATRPGPCPGAAFDLVFLDPPYGRGLGERALAAVRAGGWIAPGALLVWEENAAMPAPAEATVVDTRRYGDTWITLIEAP